MSAHIQLAEYACHWKDSRGRLYPQDDSQTRTPFQRDRDRIIHCTAFRRLMHKTQVFISPERDHVRTRLTHSIEVAQIARSIARVLQIDEDLTEAVALAHDLGHTPFGHTGEDALDDVMQPFGGFDHNDQALRVLAVLERRYPDFQGLNLTWETLEGVVKHNGPLIGPNARKKDVPVPSTISWLSEQVDLELDGFASLEAQVAAIADDIAYNHHDMDDGLRAGLFAIEDVFEVPHIEEAYLFVRQKYPKCDEALIVAEMVRHLIGEMVDDVLRETKKRLNLENITSIDDVRNAERQMVAFSGEMAEKERSLKRFLFARMYRAPSVNQEREVAFASLGRIFRHYMRFPDQLPGEWRGQASEPYSHKTARIVTDYIAGMTDRFARKEAEALFGE